MDENRTENTIDRRTFLAGSGAVLTLAGAGAATLPFGGNRADNALAAGQLASGPSRYVFASDPRASFAGYRVLPG